MWFVDVVFVRCYCVTLVLFVVAVAVVDVVVLFLCEVGVVCVCCVCVFVVVGTIWSYLHTSVFVECMELRWWSPCPMVEWSPVRGRQRVLFLNT